MKKVIFLCTLLSLASIKADSLKRLNPGNIKLTAKWLRKSSDRLENIENIEKDAEVYQTVLDQDSIDNRIFQVRANLIGLLSLPAFTLNLIISSPLSSYPYTFENKFQEYTYGGIWLTYTSLVAYLLYRVNKEINNKVAINGKITDALEEMKQAHMLKQ